MFWKQFLTALVKFLAPLALDWLKKLLEGLDDKLGAKPADPLLAVHDVFAAARRELWWFQFGRRRQLDAVQRVALRHAATLNAASVGLGEPTIDGVDRAAIEDAA